MIVSFSYDFPFFALYIPCAAYVEIDIGIPVLVLFEHKNHKDLSNTTSSWQIAKLP